MAVSDDMLAQGVQSTRTGRRNVAFLIESMIVLALLMASMAVFVQIFSSAQLEGRGANRLSKAVVAATNCAETFSADPTSVPATAQDGDLTVLCDVDVEEHENGDLYNATITVKIQDEVLYTLHTARYLQASGGDEA